MAFADEVIVPAAYAYAHSVAATVRAVADPLSAADAVVGAAYAPFDPTAANAILMAVEADCRSLEIDGDGLMEQPLWLTSVGGDRELRASLPSWALSAFNKFARGSLAKETSFGLIVDWYRGILPDGNNASPRSLFGKKADIQIATMPDVFWTVTKERTAIAIMDDVAAIGGWRQGQYPFFTDFQLPQYATDFVLEFLMDLRRPAKTREIADALEERNILIKRSSLNWMLSNFSRSGQIVRVNRGEYAFAGWKSDPDLLSERPVQPAVPPLQGHGPHLGISDGQIVFAPVSNTAGSGNDLARVARYLPLAREALVAFLFATPVVSEGSNDPFQRERRLADRYIEASSSDIQSIDFDLLFGVGTMLMNRLAAEATRSLDSDLAPLSVSQKLSLADFKDTHAPMIVSTAAGADAVADAEKISRSPAEEKRYRETVADFMIALKAETGIARPEVAELLVDSANEMGTGQQAERSFRFGAGAARNAAIVVTSVGTVAALPMVGLALGGAAFAWVSGVLAYVLWEAVKKTKPFAHAIKPLTGLIDGLSELDQQKLDELIESGTSDRFARFTLKEEARLREIAGDRPEFQWLHQQLDFLKANYARKE